MLIRRDESAPAAYDRAGPGVFLALLPRCIFSISSINSCLLSSLPVEGKYESYSTSARDRVLSSASFSLTSSSVSPFTAAIELSISAEPS